MEVLANIPDNQTLKMKLDQDNTKAIRSPPIREKFAIFSNGVYNFALNELKNKNFKKVYLLMVEFKKLIRCVWQTKFTRAETPNISLLKQISSFNVSISPFYGNKVLMIYPNKKLNNHCYEVNKIDEESLIIIERNLIPSFEYNLRAFNDSNWDEYLLIYDNILLSEIIQYRKEQLKIRDEDIRLLNETRDDIGKEEYEQQRKDILNDYSTKIDNIKNDYIFKAINYLNWLYYNNVNRYLAWSVILLRLSTLTKCKYHDELYKHSENDIIEYIRACRKETKFELLQFYVSVIVYLYQFKHHSISTYDKEYLEIMIKYLTNNLPTYDEYINQLYHNLTDNLIILRHLVETKDLMKYIKTNELNKFSYKLKALSDELHKYYSEKELIYYDINDKIKYLIDSSDINKLFNKITSKTYNDVSKKLENYDIKHVLTCFIDVFINTYTNYTFYTIHYMIEHFGRTKIKNAIVKHFEEGKGKEDGKLIGIIMAMFDDIKFYKYSNNRINTLTEIPKNEPTIKMLKFALGEATTLYNEVKTGYDKFTLETTISTIKDMLPQQTTKSRGKNNNKANNDKENNNNVELANNINNNNNNKQQKKTLANNIFAALADSDDDDD